MTSRAQMPFLTFSLIWLFQLCCVNKCKTKKERQTTKQKNIAGQVLTYNSKNFHWLNRKLDQERTMNGLGKPFRKKSDPKNRKNCKKSKWNCRMWTKNHDRESEFLSKHPFSRSTLNLEQKNSRRKTTRFFAPLPVSAWPKSLLQFDFKNENVWTDLKKKDSAPIQFKFFEL